MMIKKLLFILVLAFNCNLSWAQGQSVEFVQYVKDVGTGNTRFAIFSAESQMDEKTFFKWLKVQQNIHPEITFKLLKAENDDLGFTHKKFVQVIHGNEIFSSMLILHLQNGLVESFNGEYYSQFVSTDFIIPESTAFETAWGLSDNLPTNNLSQILVSPEFGKNKYISRAFCPDMNEGQLSKVYPCYIIDLVNDNPYINEKLLWNANDNSIMNRLPVEIRADSNGKAVTHYLGTQNIVSDHIGANNFRLRESSKRHVSTYKTNLYGDYFDGDNYWDNGTDKIAGDVHFGAELVSDFLKSYFGRNGYGNKGDTFNSITTAGSGNAFWNLGLNTATFLVGTSGTIGPCASLDVVAHEYGHGICDESGGLLYTGEACALHESFADINGHMVEHFRDSTKANWYLGEQVWTSSNGIRNMEDPHLYNDPKAYGGKFFPKGCHGSGGVQNRWFYLMVQGDTGVNEFSYSYSLKGLGHYSAAQITYRSIFYYLIPNSTFKDALYGSLKAAKDIYGGCSEELDHTFKAWKAVNVDDPTISTVDLSHGIAAPSQVCKGAPVSVFLNSRGDKSRKVKWLIDHKDTSSQFSLNHTFNKTGYFSVILETNTCGTSFFDSVVIAVNESPIPQFVLPFDTVCFNGDTTRFVNTTKNLDPTIGLNYEWYLQPTDEFFYTKDLNLLFNQKFTYNITLKAFYPGGCSNRTTKSITVSEAYKPDFRVLRNACQDRQVKLENLSDTANRGLKFTWIFPDKSQYIGYLPDNKSISDYGIQTIILQAESGKAGCKDTVSRQIEIYRNPVVDFLYDSFCRNATAMLITQGTFFAPKDWTSWHVGYANPINKDTFMVDVGDSTSRLIGLTLSDKNGCNATLYKEISVENLEVDMEVEKSCLGDSSMITYKIVSGSGYTTTWNSGNGFQSHVLMGAFLYDSEGKYNVSLEIENGHCKKTKQAIAEVLKKPVSLFTANEVCEGQKTIFNNQSKNLSSPVYEWLFADGNSSNAKDPEHVYAINATKTFGVWLKVLNDNGCRDSITIPVTVNELPNCGFTVERDPLNGNNSFVFTPNAGNEKSYYWQFGDGNGSTEKSPTYQYVTVGNYQVSLKIESEANCSCEEQKVVSAIYLGMNEETPLCEFKVYPNPFCNAIRVDAFNGTQGCFELYSANGVIVKKGNLIGTTLIQTDDLSEGLYILRMDNGNAKQYVKLVK